jgi:hypothetical protein
VYVCICAQGQEQKQTSASRDVVNNGNSLLDGIVGSPVREREANAIIIMLRGIMILCETWTGLTATALRLFRLSCAHDTVSAMASSIYASPSVSLASLAYGVSLFEDACEQSYFDKGNLSDGHQRATYSSTNSTLGKERL